MRCFTVAAAPPITFVQTNYATPQTATTVGVAFAAAQTAGDLNVVVVGWDDVVQTVQSVVDTKGNVYSAGGGADGAGRDGDEWIREYRMGRRRARTRSRSRSAGGRPLPTCGIQNRRAQPGDDGGCGGGGVGEFRVGQQRRDNDDQCH